MNDTVFVIENENKGGILGICDSELDVLRCLVYYDMIDLEKVNEELRKDDNPKYNDVVTWLADGATVDDLGQFLTEGNCYSMVLNVDLSRLVTFEHLMCPSDDLKNEYLLRFPDHDERTIRAAFPEEAEIRAMDAREKEGFKYEIPRVICNL